MSRLRFTLQFVPFAFLATATFHAQQSQPQEPLHAPDGGTIERIQSIDIPPTPNAPFTANVVTTWTRIMPDGSKTVLKNHRIVARDSAGNIYEERRRFTPNGDVQPTMITQLEYADPNLHELYVCNPQAMTCRVFPYNRPAALPKPQPVGALPSGNGTFTREDLGRKTMEGVDLIGTREVTTLNQGAFGNEKPQPIVKEFWFSPRLAINVITRRFDPRASGSQDFTVTNINLSEPDHQMMRPPGGFRVIRSEPQFE